MWLLKLAEGVQMRHTSIISILACSLSVGLVSCSGKKKDKGNEGIPITAPSGKPEPSEVKDLIGTWFGECKVFDTNSNRFSATFSKDSAVFADEMYVDTQCKNRWYTKRVVSNYFAGKNSVNGLKEIDLVAVAMSHTPHTQNEANVLNDEKPCGYSNWKINVEVDVTNLPCSEDSRPIKKGDQGYDVYSLTNGAKTLQFGFDPFAPVGEQNRGRNPDERPSTVNTYKYQKQ